MDSDIQTYVSSHSEDHGYAGRIDIVTGPTGPGFPKATDRESCWCRCAGLRLSNIENQINCFPIGYLAVNSQVFALKIWRKEQPRGVWPI